VALLLDDPPVQGTPPSRARWRRPAAWLPVLLPALLAAARTADLPVKGLMAVPPLGVDAAPYFALLAKLARDHGLAGLSMGMSDDLETAVMLGATHVRVGTALFGARA